MDYHRTVESVLTLCLTFRGNPTIEATQRDHTSVDLSEWLDEIGANAYEVLWANLDQLVRAVRIQFLGLGLIEYIQVSPHIGQWVLTERARLQLLATHGISRNIN